MLFRRILFVNTLTTEECVLASAANVGLQCLSTGQMAEKARIIGDYRDVVLEPECGTPSVVIKLRADIWQTLLDVISGTIIRCLLKGVKAIKSSRI
ncbi:hypothetical protein B0H67DRAFT_595602 [Lasiosphaeris hirsuta]|uniref:Uncharacterized protein n=1 Tax=Lasiosphaeris hirsuta TaxID=260670 RepID=A0AA40DGN1_9PEZI|nr:hypothetical protein B0H67DRAFT_595602 [Lasiosphaeris hirsuta]